MSATSRAGGVVRPIEHLAANIVQPIESLAGRSDVRPATITIRTNVGRLDTPPAGSAGSGTASLLRLVVPGQKQHQVSPAVLAELVDQVTRIVAESGYGSGSFDAAGWVDRWLEEPHAALGGRRPIDVLDGPEGSAAVHDLIARMQSGAYG